jgi:hypothetical protein
MYQEWHVMSCHSPPLENLSVGCVTNSVVSTVGDSIAPEADAIHTETNLMFSKLEGM